MRWTRWTPFSLLILTGSARLLLRCLPWAALIVAIKWALFAVGFEPLELSPLLAAAISAEVFVVGFLLSGTTADYKEAERLPGELAAALETLADHLATLAQRVPSDSARAALAQVERIGVAASEWVHRDADLAGPLSELHQLNRMVADLGSAVSVNQAALNNEQASIRRTLMRIGTIRRTSYVAAGYLIGEVIALALLVVLLLTDLGALAPTLALVGLISFLLMYLVALIRDLDNPFEYSDGQPGEADVDLEVLHQGLERIAALRNHL